jgi:integrase/recombinase XerD
VISTPTLSAPPVELIHAPSSFSSYHAASSMFVGLLRGGNPVTETIVKEAVGEYLYDKRHLRSKTVRWYTHRLGVFCKWCETQQLHLSAIKAKHVSEFIDQLPVKSTYTRRGYAQVVKGFMSWCSKEEDFEDDVKDRVVKRIELPKVEQSTITIFTTEEISRLYKACNLESSTANRYRDKAILSILLDTGIRASEICYDQTRPEEKTGLRVSMLDYSTHDPHIRVYGKGNKQRELPLGDKARKDLKSYIERYRGKVQSDYAFIGKGEPLSVRGLKAMLDRIAVDAGIQECYPHKFRHTFAMNYLIQSGVNGESDGLVRLMRLMGHTEISTTMIYLRAVQERQRGGHSVLDNL